jgi:O-antigen/teichoic acid export membrane protein
MLNSVRTALIARYQEWLQKDQLAAPLFRDAVLTFVLNIFAKGVTFFAVIVLARLLGVEQYGTYVFVLSCMVVLSIPAMCGMNPLLVRLLPYYQVHSSWGLRRGFARWSTQLVFALASGFLVLGLIATFLWPGLLGDEAVVAFRVGFLFIPLIALLETQQSTFRAVDRVVIGQIPLKLIHPVILLVVATAAYIIGGRTYRAEHALLLYGVSATVAYVVGITIWIRTRPTNWAAHVPEYAARSWLRLGLPLLVIGGISVINERTDVLLLGVLAGKAATGLYAVASSAALLISFVLQSFAMPLGPVISRMHAKGDRGQLENVLMFVVRAILIVAVPLAVLLILFRQPFLEVFGRDYLVGSSALVVLVAGQCLCGCFGPARLTLIVTGYARHAAAGIGLGTGVNVILALILIPHSGIEGAAVAKVTGLMIQCAYHALFVYRLLNVNTTVLGLLKTKASRP